MTNKYKVSDLAKDLGMNSKDVAAIARYRGVNLYE